MVRAERYHVCRFPLCTFQKQRLPKIRIAFPLKRSIAVFRDFKKAGKEEQIQALSTEAARRGYLDCLGFCFQVGDAMGIPEMGFFFVAVESWN